jgi:DNA polymerase III delta subunit
VAPVHLIASSDDFLLEERVREVARTASESLGVESELLPPEITPEDLATELCSPSVFAPHRVFVIPDLGAWLVPTAKGKTKKSAESEPVDVTPVVGVLEEGLSPDIALVMGAWCKSSPKGPLVKAVNAAGTFEWLAGPDDAKPWDDAELSDEQEKVLRGLLARTAGNVKFSEGAQRLLMHRLGYAPRLLIQEARKLVAAHVDNRVDEDLVRALCFPRERSLDAVRDAVFAKRAAPILDLLTAVEAGIPVRDWQGQLMTEDNVPFVIAAQVGLLCQQMLYLRRLVKRVGMEQEMTPERTDREKWYPYQFKNGIGPALMEHLKNDAPSPVFGGRKPPSLFTLGQLFRGASRYRDGDLVGALADFGETEAGLRGKLPAERLSVWLTVALGEPSADQP